jgi:non-ribosomal peptide synthase protein (TIGR01720 family)
MYKSGDLSRWLPNGDIEFLGRIDNQVKIRGFRIELGEIENQLLKIEGIKEAVVIERESERGDKYLCGYIVCDKAKSFDITGTREKLSENLPGYMIPTYFVELDKIPLVSSGKIDRKSLPVPGVNEGDNDVLPSNMIEEKLCDVWREVLGIESIGTQANFFEVGGDSIKAIQVSSRLQKYGLKLSIQDLFRYPRISDLSKYVKKMDRVIDQSPVSGEIPLTPIQKWFLRVAPEAQDSALPADQGKNSTNKEDCTCLHHFNQSVMLYKEDGFHEDILRAVFNKLTNHHDILRVVFKRDNGKIIQFNRGIDGKYYDMDIYDFNGESDVKSLILEKSQKIQSSINLYQGPLLKIGLFKTGEGDHLLIVIHHLVVDGVSWRIILEDLFKGYEQCLRGENIRLQDKTDSFKYWSEEQERYSESFRLSRELAYWKEVEEAEIKPLKRDFEPGESRLIAKNERVLSFVLEKESTDKLLRESNRAYNTEINDLLLASLALSIREWAGLETILINLEGHGREDIGIDVDVDISRTVGWFTSQCPVLLKIKKPEDLSYTIRDIKEVLRGIPNKGIGYGILRYLTPAAKKRGINFRSKPEISFNYLGEFVGEAIDNEVFNMSGMPQGSLQSPEMKSNYRININGMISGDQLSLSFSYNRYEYKEETINKLCSYYKRYLLEIIEHCNLKEEMVKTPSDLDYSEIDIDELEDIKNFVNQIE